MTKHAIVSRFVCYFLGVILISLLPAIMICFTTTINPIITTLVTLVYFAICIARMYSKANIALNTYTRGLWLALPGKEPQERNGFLSNIIEPYNKAHEICVKDRQRIPLAFDIDRITIFGINNPKPIIVYGMRSVLVIPVRFLEAVFAHELGHVLKNHSIQNIFIQSLKRTYLPLRIISIAICGLSTHSLPLVITSLVIFCALKYIQDHFTNCIKKYQEYLADIFTAENGYGEALVETLDYLMTLDIGADISSEDHDHPSIQQRLTTIKLYQQK